MLKCMETYEEDLLVCACVCARASVDLYVTDKKKCAEH